MQPIQINVRIDLGLDGRLFALLSSVAGRRAPAQGLPEADAASEGTPASTRPGAKPEVEDKPAPAREEAPARPGGSTEVDVHAAMDRVCRRIEGEDYKENPDGEGYKRWHRALTAWFKGTAAPRLEADVPDSGSAYAEEGTLAHAYCAMKLKGFLGRDTSGEAREIGELGGRYHTGEMDECTDAYKAIVLEKYAAARAKTEDARLLVETRLDFGDYVPEAFGTADAVIIADGAMEVIDFKYGKGVKVPARRNPQMMIYALGPTAGSASSTG